MAELRQTLSFPSSLAPRKKEDPTQDLYLSKTSLISSALFVTTRAVEACLGDG
jgi:hypothetical protein